MIVAAVQELQRNEAETNNIQCREKIQNEEAVWFDISFSTQKRLTEIIEGRHRSGLCHRKPFKNLKYPSCLFRIIFVLTMLGRIEL
jgi:hypothetical protein